jgi:hypothetical protein
LGFPKKRGKVLKSPRVVVCFWRWRDTVHSLCMASRMGSQLPAKGGNKTNNTLVLFVQLSIQFPFPCAAKRGQGAHGYGLPLYGLRMSDLAFRRPGIQKKTCGSTVFSTGHPRQYSLAPAMLVCADRTRRGRFIAVWPQIRSEDSGSYRPLPKSCRQSNFRCALSRLLALPGLAQYLQDLSRPVFFSGGRRRPTQAADSPLVMLRSLWTGAPVAVGLAVHREGEGPLVVLALIHQRCPPEVL